MKKTCGVISDTHGYIDPGILHILQSCDCIVHAGDIGNWQIMELLEQITPQVVAVNGNNDCKQKWPAGQHKYLEKLLLINKFQLGNYQICVTHGHQFNPANKRHSKLRNAFPTSDIIIYGHSHKRCIDQNMRPWVVNPGAAGKSRTYGGASCIKITLCRDDLTINEHCARSQYAAIDRK